MCDNLPQDLRRVDPVFDLTSGEGDTGRRHALHVDGRLPDADNETSREGSVTVNKLNRYGQTVLIALRQLDSLSSMRPCPGWGYAVGAACCCARATWAACPSTRTCRTCGRTAVPRASRSCSCAIATCTPPALSRRSSGRRCPTVRGYAGRRESDPCTPCLPVVCPDAM